MKATTSLKQVHANRKNAKKSTGPRTAAGRARSVFNGLKHGLASNAIVVPGLETVEAWEAHRKEILDSIQPRNALEAKLAERAAVALWRLERCTRAERAELQRVQDPIEEHESKRWKLKTPDWIRYEIENERGAEKALEDVLGGAPDDKDLELNALEYVELTVAEVCGIVLVVHDAGDGSTYRELPATIYQHPEDDDHYTVGEVRIMIRACVEAALRSPRGRFMFEPATFESVASAALATVRWKIEHGEETLVDLESKIRTARDAVAIPNERDNEHIARYENAADRALSRALASLAAVRELASDRKIDE